AKLAAHAAGAPPLAVEVGILAVVIGRGAANRHQQARHECRCTNRMPNTHAVLLVIAGATSPSWTTIHQPRSISARPMDSQAEGRSQFPPVRLGRDCAMWESRLCAEILAPVAAIAASWRRTV